MIIISINYSIIDLIVLDLKGKQLNKLEVLYITKLSSI